MKANIQEETDRTAKQGMLIITGDWNAKVGNKADSNSDEKCGLGVRNEATIGLWTPAKSTTCPSQTQASNDRMSVCVDITRRPLQKSNRLCNWKQEIEKPHSLHQNKTRSRLQY